MFNKILSLEMDEPAREIGRLAEAIWPTITVRAVIGKNLHRRSTIRKGVSDVLEKASISPSTDSIITIYGSGIYHHYTYGLCREIADKKSEHYGYIHFDNHDDCMRNSNGELRCGSFVNAILEDEYTHAKDALFIGNLGYNGSKSIGKSEYFSHSDAKNAKKKLEELLMKLPENAYLSFDLDIMDENEIRTDYHQGYLETLLLLDFIDMICEKKNIIGVDILGACKTDDFKGQLLYVILIKKFLDEDLEKCMKLREKMGTRRNISFDKIAKRIR